MNRTILIAAVALLSIPATTSAYEIAWLKPIHESLTHLTSRCAAVAPAGRGPAKDIVECAGTAGALTTASLKKAMDDYTSPTASAVERSARWSDDPGRATAGYGGLAKYALKMKTFCPGITDYDTRSIYDVGLLCSVHFGKMSFVHAMASSEGERSSDTRAKVLAWAQFTYDVASGSPRAPLGANLCRTMRNTRAYADLAASFDDGAGCSSGKAWWTVRDLFTFDCTNPGESAVCGSIAGNPVTEARLAARGALLHLIQDSYSLSHAARGKGEVPRPDSIFKPAIECNPIRTFYFYGVYKALGIDATKTHDSADKRPQVDPGCVKGSTVTDPVSAGATMLRMIDRKAGSDAARQYLAGRVFVMG